MRQPTVKYLIGGSLLVLAMGLLVTVGIPAIQAPEASEQATRYNDVQQNGRSIYIREGCWYCHTQQVRAVEAERGMVYQTGDIGPESQPGDYAYQKPVLWGTNRQGPDLTFVSRRPYANGAWHIAHLEDPRAVVNGSLMPSFAHLSDGDLKALVEYLLTLR
jgi:cbb3-type cytochrome c oxidase subunit II